MFTCDHYNHLTISSCLATPYNHLSYYAHKITLQPDYWVAGPPTSHHLTTVSINSLQLPRENCHFREKMLTIQVERLIERNEETPAVNRYGNRLTWIQQILRCTIVLDWIITKLIGNANKNIVCRLTNNNITLYVGYNTVSSLLDYTVRVEQQAVLLLKGIQHWCSTL